MGNKRGKIIPSSFYRRPTIQVAYSLLGKVLCVKNQEQISRSKIVETEAYLGLSDDAAHSFGDRRTPRTESMYLSGGHAYVYFIYGMHFCLNVVTREAGCPEAVLLRAVEPIPTPIGKPLTNGPGKLCKYYKITKALNGKKMFRKSSGIWIEKGAPIRKKDVAVSARIGIPESRKSKNLLLRFYLRNNRFVSKTSS